MKRLLKDRSGMSLMEILVAISLLLIVIVGTTPVMLSAYDGLYTAGEYTQKVYDAKSEIEDQLAQGIGDDSYPEFNVSFSAKSLAGNFTDLGQVASINSRRAVSSLYTSLETLFTTGKAYVAIVSSKVINDDTVTKTVILQTTNIDFSFTDSSTNTIGTGSSKPGEPKIADGKNIDITAILPDKSQLSSQLEEKIYAGGDNYKASVNVVAANSTTGRITIEISDAPGAKLDFTNSPVKIMVSYYDENNKLKTVSCYLTIKTPTIMLAGTTNNSEYYTTSGVQIETVEKTDASGKTYHTNQFVKLKVDGRDMTIENVAVDTQKWTHGQGGEIKIVGGASAMPTGTIIKSINWIDTDTTTSNVEPYYVLTGSNGAIYRTYSFTGSNSTLMSTVGVDGNEQGGYSLTDKQKTTVYPSLWGGDMSYQFGYSTYGYSMGYAQGDWSWYTEDEDNYGFSDPNSEIYGTTAKYAYYYNGWGMSYTYDNQKSRTISYILTETGYSLRMGGWMESFNKGYNENYNKIWENPLNVNLDVGSEGNNTAYSSIFSGVPTVYYGRYDKSESPAQSRFYPYYLGDRGSEGNRFRDANFAQIRVKYLSTLSPSFIKDSSRRFGQDDSQSDVHWINPDVYYGRITVTDAVYIPPVDGAVADTTGKMFYVGTVAANGYLNQIDNLGPDSSSSGGGHWAKYVYWRLADNYGRTTAYYISANDDGTETNIWKYSIAADKEDYNEQLNTFTPLMQKTTTLPTNKYTTNTDDARTFFVTRSAGETKSAVFTDVAFTMGFTSNRDMVYAQITYGLWDASDPNSRKEQFKSYEHYYFLSRYGNSTHLPTFYMNSMADSSQLTINYRNSIDNDYYNVWFPGEMYNLTKVATKDNVTVAVGYAVSGTTYQFVNPSNQYNTSTGLSGIQNDGVLAAMIGGVDSSFANLLYFKDNTNVDTTSLTDSTKSALNSSTYQAAYGSGVEYGTHQRNSVQFTCVDISIEYITDTTNNKEVAVYYAYYADNRGRLFKSKVATKITSTTGTTSGTPVKVDWISDQPTNPAPISTTQSAVTTSNNIGYMNKVKTDSGNEIGDYFSKITTIRCEGDYIIVSGYSKTADFGVVVGKITPVYEATEIGYETQVDENGNKVYDANGEEVKIPIIEDIHVDNTVSWKYLKIGGAAAYQVEDILVLEGYVYFAGSVGSNGWVYAVALEELDRTADNGDLVFNDLCFTDTIPDKIYTLAGHSSD